MTAITRTALKAFFQTGDIPTEAQFIDVFDSSPNIVDDGLILGGNGAVTAFAGGGQANATLLTTQFNSITVCATPNDSVRFPNHVAGNMFGIVNATANACDLFPAVGEQIMALGVNNPQSMASGEVWFYGSSGGGWAGGRLT